jgi:hypothetical protein
MAGEATVSLVGEYYFTASAKSTKRLISGDFMGVINVSKG